MTDIYQLSFTKLELEAVLSAWAFYCAYGLGASGELGATVLAMVEMDFEGDKLHEAIESVSNRLDGLIKDVMGA